MTQQVSKNLTFLTPPGIGSFVTLLEPKPDDKGKMWYSLSILISKAREKELAPLRALIETAAKGMFGPNAMQQMQGGVLRNPIRDGDQRFLADSGLYKAYKGMLYISARTNRKPQVLDAAKNPIFSDEDVYSGCMVRAHVSVFAYNKAGNRGVGLGLNHVQVLQKLERLDGRKSAEEVFTEWSDSATATDDDPTR